MNHLMRRARRHGEQVGQRWRVGAGLAIVAVFVALGIIPARRGLTVRYHGRPQRPARPSKRRRARRKSLLRRLLAR